MNDPGQCPVILTYVSYEYWISQTLFPVPCLSDLPDNNCIFNTYYIYIYILQSIF